MQENPLEAENIGFTPSEIDELETIELPSSEQPAGYWSIEDRDKPPFCPGQMLRTEASADEIAAEMLKNMKAEGPCEYHPLFGSPLFGPPQPLEQGEPSSELQWDRSEPQQDGDCSLPQKQGRLRQCQLRARADGSKEQEQLLPPLRHSARIADMKHAPEPLLSQTRSNKRFRRRLPKPAALAGTPVAQASPCNTWRTSTRLVSPHACPGTKRKETRPRQGRGTLRKDNGPTIRSTLGKKELTKMAAPARTRSRTRPPGTVAPTVPRRQGMRGKND